MVRIAAHSGSYVPTYPLLCLAAQYSDRVYSRPQGAERDTHVVADWRTGTKAMVIKSVPMDYMSTIVFAIRGTATFMDWAVNLNMEPSSPVGFLVRGFFPSFLSSTFLMQHTGRWRQLLPPGLPLGSAQDGQTSGTASSAALG